MTILELKEIFKSLNVQPIELQEKIERLESMVNDSINAIDTIDDINISYYIKSDELELSNVYNDIKDKLENASAFDVDIIYYSDAIDYLKKNDPSLQESFSLTYEMGYPLKDLDSEILASLLASQHVREKFSEAVELAEEIENELDDMSNVYKQSVCCHCLNELEQRETEDEHPKLFDFEYTKERWEGSDYNFHSSTENKSFGCHCDMCGNIQFDEIIEVYFYQA